MNILKQRFLSKTFFFLFIIYFASNLGSEFDSDLRDFLQTEEQYIFIHDALLEAIQSGDTCIPTAGLTRYIKMLQATNGPTDKQKQPWFYLQHQHKVFLKHRHKILLILF